MNVAIRERNIARRLGADARLGHYHFYLLDNEGKVYSAASMYCDDDGDAMDRAPFELRRSQWHPAIEVWHGPRFVGRIAHRLAS